MLSPVIFMIFTCCVDIITDCQVVAASFLNQHLWYGVMTDLMGLQILAENGVGIIILCSSLYSWMPVRAYNLLHLPHIVLIPHCSMLQLCMTILTPIITPKTGTWLVLHTPSETSAMFVYLIFPITGKFVSIQCSQ
jgi:hypothetical protein